MGCVIQSKQQYDTDADAKLTKMAFTHCILIRPGLSFIITENNYLWLAMHEWATSPMSTCYCKSGGVGSNPAQVNMSFAHLKNVWQWIVVLFDEEATQMAKISMPHQGLCIWYRKGQTNFSERDSNPRHKINRSPSDVHNSSVEDENRSCLCKIVSYHVDLANPTGRY